MGRPTSTDRMPAPTCVKNPEQANALHLSTFRFDKQVVTGMEKEQVTMLLGAPLSSTTDQAEIEKLARKYWRQIQANNVSEVLVYELGWRFYFSGTKTRRHHAISRAELSARRDRR